MDNERHAIENISIHYCINCRYWKQFSINEGFCDKVGTPFDETFDTFGCDNWESDINE